MPAPHDPSPIVMPGDPAATHSLADPAAATSGDESRAPVNAAPPSSDRYTLGDEIARGGMGVVYRGTDNALRRDVAVKVLQDRFGPASAAARRFADEARIAAQLQHPAIPPVHDLGTLPDGRPFLAMKLIEGGTLADLLKLRPDPAHERGRFVATFEQICQAVAFAHSRGIIHRDLKPANVMVGSFGEVQVMDWGLAKEIDRALASPPTHETRPEPAGMVDADQTTEHRPSEESTDDRTRTGQAIGTPAYMPPEQARGDVGMIDRRADVFALGGILSMILTGKPPYTGPNAGDVMRKAIAGDLDETFAGLDACNADAELIALARHCLAADPTLRPSDAGDVARLVAAYRSGVEERLRAAERDRAAAEATAVGERKRRRVVLAAAAAVASVLLAGGSVSAWQAVRARTEADNARQAESAANKARDRAEDTSKYMQEVFTQGSSTGQARPNRSVKPNLTVKEAMDYAAKGIEGRFQDRPELEAELRQTIGLTYHQLGAFDEAYVQFKRALELCENSLGPNHRSTLNCMLNLARPLRARGRYDEAEPLMRRALAGCESVFGSDSPDTLGCIHDLAIVREARGDYEEAEQLFRRCLAGLEKALGPDHTDTITTVDDFAALLKNRGRYDEAEPLARRAMAGFEKSYGPDHPDTLLSVQDLASLLRAMNKYDEVEPLLRRAIAGFERTTGSDSSGTILSLNELGSMFRAQGRYDEAEPLSRKVLAGYEKMYGPDHAYTLVAVNNLAVTLQSLGRLDEAESLCRRSLAGSEKARGPDHRDTLTSVHNLASLLQDRRQYDEAERLYRRALVGKEKALGPDHPSTLNTMKSLGFLYFETRRYTDAVPLLERALRGYEKRPEAGLSVAESRSMLGLSLLAARKPAAAEPHLLAGFDGLTKQKVLSPTNRNRLRWVTRGLVDVYEETNQPEKAKEWAVKLAALPPESAPPPRAVKQ